MALKPQVRAFGYGRISKSKDDQKYSQEGQQEAVQRYYDDELKKDGVKFPRGAFFFDEDVSGGKRFFYRPKAMLLDRELQRGDHIIIAKLDRMFRNAEDGLRTVRVLESRGINLHFLDFKIDTRTAIGKAFLTIGLAMAQLWRDQTSERNKAQALHKQKRGLPIGGEPPLGWSKQHRKAKSFYIPNFKERAELEAIAARSGGSRDVQKQLQREGILFRGRTIQTARTILKIRSVVKRNYPINWLGLTTPGRPGSWGQQFPKTDEGGFVTAETHAL